MKSSNCGMSPIFVSMHHPLCSTAPPTLGTEFQEFDRTVSYMYGTYQKLPQVSFFTQGTRILGIHHGWGSRIKWVGQWYENSGPFHSSRLLGNKSPAVAWGAQGRALGTKIVCCSTLQKFTIFIIFIKLAVLVKPLWRFPLGFFTALWIFPGFVNFVVFFFSWIGI